MDALKQSDEKTKREVGSFMLLALLRANLHFNVYVHGCFGTAVLYRLLAQGNCVSEARCLQCRQPLHLGVGRFGCLQATAWHVGDLIRKVEAQTLGRQPCSQPLHLKLWAWMFRGVCFTFAILTLPSNVNFRALEGGRLANPRILAC